MVETVAAAFSFFSALPVPRVVWNGRNLRWMLCAFPLVGLAVGLLCLCWGLLCEALSLPAILWGAGWTLLPAALTGGIHLDGYADTADALASHGTPEKKQAILRDSHCGAFAVLWLCMYFLGSFALYTSLALYSSPALRTSPSLSSPVPYMPDTPAVSSGYGVRLYAVLVPMFPFSRALSGLLLTVLPLAEGSALARTFVTAMDRRRTQLVLTMEAAAAGFALLALGGRAGAVMLGAALAAAVRYIWAAKREFHGTSGDLAGWFLQKAEFWMLAALVLARAVEAAV